MYFKKQVEELGKAEYCNGAANIVLDVASFSIFKKVLKFSK